MLLRETYSFPPNDRELNLGKASSISRDARSLGKLGGLSDGSGCVLWLKRSSKVFSASCVCKSTKLMPQPMEHICEFERDEQSS